MSDDKVRERLMSILRTDCGRAYCEDHSGERLANQILKSPGLRIEIVEPRYTVTGHYSEYPYQYWVMESQKGGGAVCIAKLEDANRAGQYADWLNSKEPA